MKNKKSGQMWASESHRNKLIQRPRNIWIIYISLIITTFVICGIVYTWQKSGIIKLNDQIIQSHKHINEQEEKIVKLNEEIAQLKNRLLVVENKESITNFNELANWKTYINKNDGYSIMYPPEFWPQYHNNLINYDVDDPMYKRRGNPDGIKIQILKRILDPNFESFSEYISYQKNIADDFNESAQNIKLGDFITMSQYTKNGPGGAFMIYTAFDKNTKKYFDILIYEPGYSKNTKLVEKIISTFEIL